MPNIINESNWRVASRASGNVLIASWRSATGLRRRCLSMAWSHSLQNAMRGTLYTAVTAVVFFAPSVVADSLSRW